ncbi:MAG: TetR/AcrR family transcriptional regulator C-terminal domain-containing protein [Pseudonocardia sp.]|nr:TetR/AcrR family transcriptional regulator C-terminal domain-containing protein [Pseudonocardia sp.]
MDAPPYARIVEAIRGRIEAGDLPPGARVPSTRQIVAEWGVAMATASKVLAALRQEGLVRVLPGVGTVVGEAGAEAEPELGRTAIVRAAIRIADAEGFDALSMRRVAAELGAGAMSLYRHVADKEELELLMRDAVFGERPLPAAPPPGWRAQLELSCRSLWQLYRRHPWLARTTSLTRPYAGPNQMPYSEWVLRTLTGTGLDDTTIFHLHLSLFGFVHGAAASLEAEAREAADTGLTPGQWLIAREGDTRGLMESGAFPNSVRIFLNPDTELDLDALFEFGLARFLDGAGVLIAGSRAG